MTCESTIGADAPTRPADGPSTLRVSLLGDMLQDAATQRRIESAMAEAVTAACGGLAQAARAYAGWLHASVSAEPDLETLTRRVAWESARDRCQCDVLGRSPPVSDSAFFIFHLEHPKTTVGRPPRRWFGSLPGGRAE